MLLAQTKFPEASNLYMKISYPPAEVKFDTPDPGSKSAVPSKKPVVYPFPELSTAME
jgi:hypothetical protein